MTNSKAVRYILMLMCTLMIIRLPVMSLAGSSLKKTLGTNKALGSPLLNENFQTNDWDPWEMICFGVFLSNMAVPFTDDYASAYNPDSSEGSKGFGYKSLVFGTGSDSQTQASLEPMLKYAMDAQKASSRQLMTRVYKITKDGDKEEILSEYTDSKFCDMNARVLTVGDSLGAAYKNKNKLDAETSGSTDVKTMSIVRLYLPAEGGQYIKVWDSADNWDLDTWIAITHNTYTNHHDDAEKDCEKLIKNNNNLVLDCFGNICAQVDGRNIIVYPAACNQYITESQKHNLVNSAVLGEQYGMASGEQIVQKLYAGDAYSLRSEEKDDEKAIVIGDAFCYFDLWISAVPGGNGKIAKILDADIKKADIYLPLNLQVVGSGQLCGGTLLGEDYDSLKQSVQRLSLYRDCMHVMYKNPLIQTTQGKASDTYTDVWTEQGEVGMFSSEPVYVLAQSSVKGNKYYAQRVAFNELFQYATGKHKPNTTAIDLPAQNVVRAKLNSMPTFDNIAEALLTVDDIENTTFTESASTVVGKTFSNGNFTMTRLFKNSLMNTAYYSPTNTSSDSSRDSVLRLTTAKFYGNDKTSCMVPTYVTIKNEKAKPNNQEIDHKTFGRILKVYPKSSLMTEVSKLLRPNGNLGDTNQEFAKWCPRVYVTYLQNYGFLNKKGENDFNKAIFDKTLDVLNTDGDSIFGSIAMTEEEKKQRVLDLSYLILDSDSSKANEYKANWFQNAASSLIYKWYSLLTGSNSLESYSDSYTTRNSYGFLSIPTYQDNFFTGWFLNFYTQYVLLLLGIFLLVVFVVGIILRKSWTWFLIATITVVNVLLATPALGDIVPYISNKAVEAMLSPKMTYWTIAESLSNSKLEEQIAEEDDGDSEVSAAFLMRAMNVVYLDRSLMLKHDISKKVVEDSTGVISDLQELSTTKWLMPILMRQFTAKDGSADYVYTALGDAFDNMTSLYWYYVPSDKLDTVTAKSNTVTKAAGDEDFSKDGTTLGRQNQLFENYESTWAPSSLSDVKKSYYNISRCQSEEGHYDGVVNSDYNITHTSFYILDYFSIGGSGATLKIPRYVTGKGSNYATTTEDTYRVIGEDDAGNPIKVLATSKWVVDGKALWEKCAANNWGAYDTLISAERVMESAGCSYNSREGAESFYGYLWLTESPMPYMYLTVRDTFRGVKTLGALTRELQGSAEISDESTAKLDNKYRVSFMHTTLDVDLNNDGNIEQSGYIRDICDMREFFYNVIPYMYSNTLVTSGNDGSDGAFGDEKMSQFKLYKDNLKSWYLRSNWVIKLMENRDMTREVTIVDLDGNEYTVKNPIDPFSYPAERPMIFSEAEMVARGYNKSMLTIPELKILQFNENVEKKWTLLLNYVNQEGMTPEILYRQMALDATLEFDKAFSVNRLVNPTMALYPQSVDLRTISFDSIMKLLLLNSTRNTSYIYGDSILVVLQHSDLGTAVLMMLIATLCIMFIPLSRLILMALMFYLSYISLLRNIVSEATTKFKITIGYFLSTLLFLALNLLYYGVFAIMINFSTADEVLTTNNYTVNAGSPAGQFTVILLFDIFYLVMCYVLGKFIVKNSKDMGFSKYAMWTSNALSKISGAVNGVGNKFTGGIGGISEVFSSIKADLTASSVGGRTGYDGIKKGGNVSRKGNEAKTEFSVKNSTTNERHNRETNSVENDQAEYRVRMEKIAKDVQEDARVSVDIRKKVESGEQKVFENKEHRDGSGTSRVNTSQQMDSTKKGGVSREPIRSNWNKRTY